MPPVTVAIIPARYRSTRLPGKALADDRRPADDLPRRRAHAPRARHRAASSSRPTTSGSATPCAARGGEVVHDAAGPSDRAPIAWPRSRAGSTADVVVNVQGDLPLLDPAMVERARRRAWPTSRSCPWRRWRRRIHDEAEWRSPHVVKVVTGARRARALLLAQPDPVRSRRRARAGRAARLAAHRPVRLPARRPAAAGGAAADAARAPRAARAAARARARHRASAWSSGTARSR